MSEGDRETSTMRMPWPTWGCCTMRKEIGWGRPFGYLQPRCANYLAVCVLVEEKLCSSFVKTLLTTNSDLLFALIFPSFAFSMSSYTKHALLILNIESAL